MSASIDWKSTGILAASVTAGLAALKKILTPFAVAQVRDAIRPLFDNQNKTLAEIRAAQVLAEREMADLRERVAKIEGRLSVP